MSDLGLRVAAVAAPVRQQLVESLRRAILEFRFKPGDRLVERELCELTGVSRTSLREGLRQLETEGLISIVPNKGPVVATVGADEAAQIYELRALLEGFMGRRFAERATEKQISALKKALATFAKAVKAGANRRDLVAAKGKFYDLLIEGSGNSALESALRNLHGRVTLLRATSMAQPGRIQKSLQELEEIMRAIEQRDANAADKACRAHVENASRTAISVLETENWAAEPAPSRVAGR